MCEMQTETKYKSQKVNQNHLSGLMAFILINTGNGIERGEILEHYYYLERRYCGYYTDPCFRPKESKDYEQRYRRANPAVSRTLKRLEKRGLIELIRRKHYAKKVKLTPKGHTIARVLIKAKSRGKQKNQFDRPAKNSEQIL